MTKKKASIAKQRQQERQRQRQRQRTIIGAVLLVVGAVAIIGLAILSSSPADAPIPADVEERYAGIPRSLTDAGFPRLGDPSAPVRLVEFSSFACEFCAVFHSNIFPSLLERIRRGEISFTYVPLATGAVPNAAGANRTAMCASEQGRFWEMHDVLFDWHSRFGNTAFSSNRIQTGVGNLGLNVNAFNDCFNSDRISNVLQSASVQGQGIGTPFLRVNDVPVGLTLLEIETEIEARLPADFVPLNFGMDAAPEAEITPEAEVTPEVEATLEVEVTPEVEATAEAE